ncbi:hypothetical protein MBLNU459_g0761t1 [Dothideomycetes sp. NU459]
MEFVGLLPELKSRANKIRSGGALVRDSFSTTTWLCLGAAVQSAAFTILGKYAVVPAVAYLLYRAIVTYAMVTGLLPNTQMDGVLKDRITAQFPDSEGHYGSKASNSDVCVFLLGTRCNHPLGLVAPGFREVSDHFAAMSKDLSANADELGLLGFDSYLGTTRGTSNEIMTLFYFRTAKDVHDYSQGPVHRKAWDWWNKTVAQHPHIAITHELYQVPKGLWESVYINSNPTGVAATQHKVTKKDGEVAWMSPVVDARKGILRSSAGRMGRDV